MKKRNLNEQITNICEENHLLSAGLILEILKKEGRKYNKTSVYRALDRLVATGKLCQHFFGTSEAFYELRSHHHAHLVCEKCGNIQTANCPLPKLKDTNNFRSDHHHLTIFGTCNYCQNSHLEK